MQDFEDIFKELSSPYMDQGVWWVHPLEGIGCFILKSAEMTFYANTLLFWLLSYGSAGDQLTPLTPLDSSLVLGV